MEININLEKELARVLQEGAQNNNTSLENFIVNILNKYLALSHTIDQEEMAKGYEEMGEINISLSK